MARRRSPDGNDIDFRARTRQRLSTYSGEVSRMPASEECTICHEVTVSGVTLPCAHQFHVRCLSQWLERSPRPTCPNCRGLIDLSDPRLMAVRGNMSAASAGPPAVVPHDEYVWGRVPLAVRRERAVAAQPAAAVVPLVPAPAPVAAEREESAVENVPDVSPAASASGGPVAAPAPVAAAPAPMTYAAWRAMDDDNWADYLNARGAYNTAYDTFRNARREFVRARDAYAESVRRVNAHRAPGRMVAPDLLEVPVVEVGDLNEYFEEQNE
jgi:hypothetical protein